MAPEQFPSMFKEPPRRLTWPGTRKSIRRVAGSRKNKNSETRSSRQPVRYCDSCRRRDHVNVTRAAGRMRKLAPPPRRPAGGSCRAALWHLNTVRSLRAGSSFKRASDVVAESGAPPRDWRRAGRSGRPNQLNSLACEWAGGRTGGLLSRNITVSRLGGSAEERAIEWRRCDKTLLVGTRSCSPESVIDTRAMRNAPVSITWGREEPISRFSRLFKRDRHSEQSP